MQSVLMTIQLLVSIALIVVILLQRSEGGALGMGGGGSGLGGLFSPRGATNTLTQATATLAILFISTCVALTVVALHTRPHSILDAGGTPSQSLSLPRQMPQPAKPGAPAVPVPHQ
ncbi:MAG: preprotein translocase subunit SecG [Rhizomicrobium sp.]